MVGSAEAARLDAQQPSSSPMSGSGRLPADQRTAAPQHHRSRHPISHASTFTRRLPPAWRARSRWTGSESIRLGSDSPKPRSRVPSSVTPHRRRVIAAADGVLVAFCLLSLAVALRAYVNDETGGRRRRRHRGAPRRQRRDQRAADAMATTRSRRDRPRRARRDRRSGRVPHDDTSRSVTGGRASC